MLTASFNILILVAVTITFCAIQCNADAVKVVNSNTKCPAGSAPKHLPHETECSLFYVCLNGKAILKKCPASLHFNRHSSVCDYPGNVDCQKDSQEKVGRETTDQCPSENPDQPVLLPHKKDCGKFYMCDAGVPHLKSCQPGLHFNPALHACDYPENAGCDSGVNKKGRDGFDILCPLNADGNPILRPHETDCRKFYTCSNGITLVHVCQDGLHFNAERQACDYPENAGCEKGVNKKGRDGFDILCPLNADGNPILRPHETDCRKFYSCSNGITLVHVCQHGLHFNAERQACDYPEKAGCEKGITKVPKGKLGKEIPEDKCPLGKDGKPSLMPHERDCRKFYSCNKGFPHLLTCQSGLHFNPKLQACDYPENAGCETVGVLRSVGEPSPFCPEVNGKIAIFYRHPSNCSVYYLCSNGLAYEFVCPARLHFNLRQKKCDYEDNAMCPIGPSGKND